MKKKKAALLPKETHVKPTKEELEENIQKATEEIEEIKEQGEPEEEAEESQEEESAPETEEIDYKEKFVNSAREAQILAARNRKANEALEKMQVAEEPTKDELLDEFPDWDMMSDLEKRLAKESLANTKRFTALSEVTKEFKDDEFWRGKVDGFLADPETLNKHPQLEGKEEEFKTFTSKPTRRGVDFGDLVSAFLYDAKTTQPAKSKGQMFETGSGGPAEKEKRNDKLSLEESRRLRETDYKKFIELLKAGKIATTEVE